jgi:8-oxo-dGTP pyrophosphatase MutT (NUDIX family)
MSETYKNPWQTLSTELIYENPWIRVREDQVIRPDGLPGIYGVIETRIATGVIPITPQLEVYLVGQWRYPFHAYSWEIVEGGTDHGEDPDDCIKRELIEEAGLVAKKWQRLGGELHLSNSFTNEVGYLYVAQDLTQVEAQPEGTEELQIRKLPLAEACSMADRGEITDAMSVIGLMRLQRMVASGALAAQN